MSRDEITMGYASDERLWSDRGGQLIVFKDWLIANRGNNISRQQEEWERSEKRSSRNSVMDSSSCDGGDHGQHGPNGTRKRKQSKGNLNADTTDRTCSIRFAQSRQC